MSEPKSYIREDEFGVLRIGQSPISLDSVVCSFQQGHSPETIRQQYPALSLEEVYGAIAYYLAHRDEVHRYLERQEQVWEEQRRKFEQNPSAAADRLRAVKASSLLQKP